MDRGAKPKVAMESGDVVLDGFEDTYDPIFTTHDAHAEPQLGVTAELLSKFWQMMGITCKEPIFIYGDNMSVMFNTMVPVSIFKNKMNSLLYHFIRESCTCNE